MADERLASRVSPVAGLEGPGRARRRLAILLPLYAAMTACVVLVVIVGLPLLAYLEAIPAIELNGYAAGFVIVAPFVMPSAVALVLGMRILLQNMLRNQDVNTAHERGTLYELVVGLTLLNTLFLALLFMRPINWPLLRRGLLLAVVAAACIAGMFLMLAGVSRGGSGSLHPLPILLGSSFLAAAMIAAVLAPALQLLRRLRNKRLATVALAAAAGIAAAAAAMAFAVIDPLNHTGGTESVGLLISFLILAFALLVFALLLLPVLLRASISYARLRRSMKPFPAARQRVGKVRGGVKLVLPAYAAVTAAVMTAVFVAFPLYFYVVIIVGEGFGALGVFLLAPFFAPLIAGAVVLALNMRAVFSQPQDSPRRAAQARRALLFSGQLPAWQAILWSVLAVVVAFVVNIALLLILSFALPLYPVAFAAAGLALAISIAAALRRVLIKRRDKLIFKTALIAAACAVAGAAAMAALAVMTVLGLSGENSLLALNWTITIMLLIIGFLLLPPLRRARAAYAQRHSPPRQELAARTEGRDNETLRA